MVTDKDIDNVCEWISNYLGADKKAIVGLSGGVDSAVVAALCVKALGNDRVMGVIMPCHSKPKDKRLALKVVNQLEIDYAIVNLSTTFNNWAKTYAKSFGVSSEEHLSVLTKGNAKARLRMTTLYAVAGDENGIVVGTTNLSESLIGYATKFGDHGVDIEPIGWFYKHEVYELAKMLQVPKQIIERAPTAGLWDGQTDEGELGLTYDQIDEALKKYFTDGDDAMVSEIEQRIFGLICSSAHKRKVIPVCMTRDTAIV